MKAHIINIGDELLIGQVINTNGSWMAEELNKRNIQVTNISIISDEKEDINKHLTLSLKEADVVLITGGLGPTKDDITKIALCDYFNDELVRNEETYELVRKFFDSRSLPLTKVNEAQALVPSKCKVILNKVGTAPCMLFENDGKVIVSMPGVPFEMKWLMSHNIIPLLEKRLGNESIIHKTILTFGIGESFLADKISSWENSLPPYIHLAYLPEAGNVRLRLSAYGNNHTKLDEEITELIEKLKLIIGDNIYGYDDETIASTVGKELEKRHLLVGTAESCTGGNIAHLITQEPGSSSYYSGSIVSYSNDIKRLRLEVKKETLEKYGAVSEKTAIEMAKGCLKAMNVNYAIATTGISGPTGATKDKPLGLVYIAIATKEKVTCNRYVFATTRDEHQKRTSNQALFDLYIRLKIDFYKK